MISVKKQPQPADFSRLVGKPGEAFLKEAPHPTDWKGRDYWTRTLRDLYDAYHCICAYSALWIPPCTGNYSVDHFIPKSVKPRLAYDWGNYRLASAKMNSRKRDYQDVLDPFKLGADWFVLDFPSLLVKPNPALRTKKKALVVATIQRLKLNDDDTCVQERLHWALVFCKMRDMDFMKRYAPFIAYELERQGLVEKIVSIMGCDLLGT